MKQYLLHINFNWEPFSWTFWFYLWGKWYESLKIQPEVKTLKHLQTCSVWQKATCVSITFLFAEWSEPWATLRSSARRSIARRTRRWTAGRSPAGSGSSPCQPFSQEPATELLKPIARASEWCSEIWRGVTSDASSSPMFTTCTDLIIPYLEPTNIPNRRAFL